MIHDRKRVISEGLLIQLFLITIFDNVINSSTSVNFTYFSHLSEHFVEDVIPFLYHELFHFLGFY